MKDQCKAAVAKALGKATLNQQEATDIENRIKDAMKSLAKKDIQNWRNLSDAEKLVKAGEFVAQDIQAQLKRKHAIAARDILTQNKNLAALDHPTLTASEVVDRMVAAHGDMSGVQSIDSKSRAIAAIYRGELVDFYTNVKGGLGVFTDAELVQKIVRERFNDSTGDPLAKKISDKMGEVFEGMRERFNRAGGDIGKLDDWGLPQTHSLEKIVLAGKQAWVQKAEGLIDTSKYVHEDGTYYSQQEIRELLEYSFDTLSSNGANKTEIGRQSFGGNSKVTSRHSESRVLHFKDAESWMEYQAEFGGMPFVDLIEAHVNGLSKDIAMVENLGSSPKNAMRILMDAAEQKDWQKGIDANDTGKSRKRAQTMFDEFSGQNTPQSEVLANLGLAYRSMNVASMLGGTTISSATDQAMIAKTAHVHGLSYWKTFGEMISQLNPKNKEDREFGYYLGIGVSELTGSISRWTDDGLSSVHGRAAKVSRGANNVANQVLRISGLQALTRASKVAFDTMLMAKYGDMTRNKSWSDLHANDKELLEGTGLNERAWQVMQLAEPHVDRKGRKLMSARAIYAIPDEKLLAAMDGDVKTLMDDIDSQIKVLDDRNALDDQRMANRSQKIDEVKRQLSQRLSDYANRKDAKSQAEKQALQDRIDLIDAQKEAATAQTDINRYLQSEKQAGRIQDFLQQVEDGRHSDKAAESTRKNIERNARQYGNRAESLGYRLGNAERRITELRTKMRKADNQANRSIAQKFKELDQRVNDLDIEFAEYQSKVAERQARRDHVSNRLFDSINDEKKLLAQKIRDEVATQFQTHLLDEQGMAVIEAGLREKTKVTGGTKRGTLGGEVLRLTTQFKSFPLSFLMRHGSRTLSRDGWKGKAGYALPLVAMTTVLGGLVVQLKELANGNDPSEMWDGEKWYTAGIDSDFLKRSFVAGGGLPILGDILIAGTDTSGRDAGDFLSGPFGSDFSAILSLTVGNPTQALNGVETNWESEAFRFAKNKIPGQNLWYTKAATNRMIFDEMQDMIAPGYREKLLRKAERDHDRTRWLGDDWGDIQMPDFERIVE